MEPNQNEKDLVTDLEPTITSEANAPSSSVLKHQDPQPQIDCVLSTSLLSDVRLLGRTLENFYAKFNPANVPRVQEFLDRYRGREAQLIKDIETKYEAQNVRLSSYMPPGGVPRPRAASSSPSMRSSSREHERDVSALPSLLLKAFAKTPGSDGPRKLPPSGGAAAIVRPQSTTTPPPMPPHAGQPLDTSVMADAPPSSAGLAPAPPPPPPPARDPAVAPRPAQPVDPVIAERDALLGEKAALARHVKALQARVDSQAAECASLETRRKEASRQSEALQRNLMSVMDRELTLHKKNEELEKRVAAADAAAAASSQEREEAVEARRVCEAQLLDTLGLQHLLVAQLHSLLIEGGAELDPYQAEDSEAPMEALEQHAAKQPGQDAGWGPKDACTVETAALRTSLAASRVELAHAFRSRAEMEERLRVVSTERGELDKQVASLQAGLSEERQRGDQLTEALERAQREVAERVRSLEEYETVLTQERQGRAGLEAQLEEARAVICGAARTRRELEGFCREFRKDVEAAASERVNQALSLSAMNMEDILSRQGSLLDLQKQLHAKEVESYKGEIVRLSKSLFESRRDLAYCEKQVAGLQSELRKAAEEVVRLREACAANTSKAAPSSGDEN